MTRPNDNCQTFLQSIGVDPSTVAVADISERGYYTFVMSGSDPHERIHVSGVSLREFHSWPSGRRDWDNFVVAATKDWEERNLFAAEVHNLIDPML